MRQWMTRTIIVAIAVWVATILPPESAEAGQAEIWLQCGTAAKQKVATVGQLVSNGPFALDGTYTPFSGCSFRVIGNVTFVPDALKIGQLFLNNLSIRNIGTQTGTATITYRHQNRAADPAIAQCVSLSADGFFYAGATFPSGDDFDLTMTVQYFKAGAVHQEYIVGQGRTRPTPAVAPSNTGCPTTTGFDVSLADSIGNPPVNYLPVSTTAGFFPLASANNTAIRALHFAVGTDAFFNPQNPAQVFNRVPPCTTGCTPPGTSTTSGARILKEFSVTLRANHEISSIATIRGAMVEQAGSKKEEEIQRAADANAKLERINTADCARMDLKPGQSVNFLHATQDQGNIIADLLGGTCFDVSLVEPTSLKLIAGVSGLEDGSDPGFHGTPGIDGASVKSWVFGDFNQDGVLDLRAQFPQGELDIRPGDDRVLMTGQTRVGVDEVLTDFAAEDSAVTQ